MSDFVRKSITVPRELSEQMAEVEDVNWSQVAATAFFQKINELRAKHSSRPVHEVIARLLQTKVQEDQGSLALGHRLGTSWAEDYATYSELRRVGELDNQQLNALVSKGSGKSKAARLMFFSLSEAHDANQSAKRRSRKSPGERTSWERLGDDCDFPRELFGDDEFVTGLVRGARQVWLKVKDRI